MSQEGREAGGFPRSAPGLGGGERGREGPFPLGGKRGEVKGKAGQGPRGLQPGECRRAPWAAAEELLCSPLTGLFP